MWRAASTGAVAEGEGLAQTWIGPVTAGGGGRVRWAVEQHGHAVLENAHVDLGVRPSLDSAVGLHARYIGVSLLQQAPLRAETPMAAGAMHAIADANRSFSSRLALAGSVGAHREDETGRYQVHGGAELRFPRMFGETGGLWFGATVEQGWLQGETAYVQFLGHFGERVPGAGAPVGRRNAVRDADGDLEPQRARRLAERRRRDRDAAAPARLVDGARADPGAGRVADRSGGRGRRRDQPGRRDLNGSRPAALRPIAPRARLLLQCGILAAEPWPRF